MIAPIYKKLAKEFAGRAVFTKVDTNRNGETGMALGVRGLPTFLVILNGKLVDRWSGADANRLRQSTEKSIQMAAAAGTASDATMPGLGVMVALLKASGQAKDASAQAEALMVTYKGKPAALMRYMKKAGYDLSGIFGNLNVQYGGGSDTGGTETETAEEVYEVDEEENTDTAPTMEDVDAVEDAKRTGPKATSPSRGAVGDDEDKGDEFLHKADYLGGKPTGEEKLVIIGGGPAGLSAAIYAARAGMTPLIVAPRIGGQLLGKGVDVENYPGVSGSMATGPGVIELMRDQALVFRTRMLNDALVGVDLTARPFKLTVNGTTADGRPNVPYTILADSLILATGAESRWLGAKGEHEFRGRGVTSCATCDGYLYKDQDVVVIGGGDTAMEDALVLARTSSSVTILHRRDSFRASRILADRVKENPKITIKVPAIELFRYLLLSCCPLCIFVIIL